MRATRQDRDFLHPLPKGTTLEPRIGAGGVRPEPTGGRHARRLTPAERAEIVAAVHLGVPAWRIAREHDVTPSYVGALARREVRG